MAAPTLYTGSDCDLTVAGTLAQGRGGVFELAFTAERPNTTHWAATGFCPVASPHAVGSFVYDTGNTNSLFIALWTMAQTVRTSRSWPPTATRPHRRGRSGTSGVNAVAGQVSGERADDA